MMGQGEPLLNLANVLKASRLLMDPAGIGAVATPHHALDFRHHPQDRRAGASSAAAEAGDFAQRIDMKSSGRR